ncbi:hypothetical protein CHS0354_021251 [Potamilus streckersoni]|uniref:Peptidase M12B propeptide domain-containing protein n=1 Tax=Potamilus streckersoni TaxID=2493646 RepID=A0AAE0VQ08_9BIVA|nr:hypothetical protein CHS0354_021251 [Potamilus streckersoni]
MNDIITRLVAMNTSTISTDFHRQKRSESFDSPVTLSLKAYGEEFTLELWHVQSVLDPAATIVTCAGNGKEIKWTGNHPDCFLRGMMTSHAGTASMSFCDELVGAMTDGMYEYHIEALPKYFVESCDLTGNLLVARRTVTTIPVGVPIYHNPTEYGFHFGSDFNTFAYNEDHGRQRRSTTNTSFEIEMALFVDQKMYEYMENVLQATTTEKKIELLMITWNGRYNLSMYGYLDITFGPVSVIEDGKKLRGEEALTNNIKSGNFDSDSSPFPLCANFKSFKENSSL